MPTAPIPFMYERLIWLCLWLARPVRSTGRGAPDIADLWPAAQIMVDLGAHHGCYPPSHPLASTPDLDPNLVSDPDELFALAVWYAAHCASLKHDEIVAEHRKFARCLLAAFIHFAQQGNQSARWRDFPLSEPALDLLEEHEIRFRLPAVKKARPRQLVLRMSA